jgi:hypothetical protein
VVGVGVGCWVGGMAFVFRVPQAKRAHDALC